MKIIQTIADIEALKATEAAPQAFIKAIEQDFSHLAEAEGINVTTKEIITFRLPYSQALLLLEKGDGVLDFLADPLTLEYVEKHQQDGITFYRAAKRIDHDFQLVYSVRGIHGEAAEQFLQAHAEWNEGLGEFHG